MEDPNSISVNDSSLSVSEKTWVIAETEKAMDKGEWWRPEWTAVSIIVEERLRLILDILPACYPSSYAQTSRAREGREEVQ